MKNVSIPVGRAHVNTVSLEKVFLISVATILLVVAVLKIHGSAVTTTSNYLDRPDEVVWLLTHRQLLLYVGLLEIAIAPILLKASISVRIRLGIVVWLAGAFLAYRLARWAGNVSAPCGCLGVLASPVAGYTATAALGWMLGGGSLLLFRRHSNDGSELIER